MGWSQKSPVRPILLAIVALGLTLWIAGCADSNGVYRDGTLAKRHSAIKGHVNSTKGYIDSPTPVRALAGATVKVKGKEVKQAITDADGNFIIYISPGDYTMTVGKDGFVSQTTNETAESKIYLEKTVNLLSLDEARAAAADSAAPASPPPANPSDRAETTGPLDEQAIKREKVLKHFLSLPDPEPPVAISKIKGDWWVDSDSTSNKVFAFVEEYADFSSGPARYSLSLSNGAKLKIRCISGRRVKDDSLVSMGHCAVLPTFSWTRMAASDVITNPDASPWLLTYRADENHDSASFYRVEDICYPDGSCTSFREAGQRALEKQREKARRGEN